MSLHEIKLSDLSINPWEKIGKEWFLVASGDESGYNMMTASWGFVGEMWSKDVFETVVRHNRYTYEFMEKNDLFTISFFDSDKKDVLKFCGANSGRNVDKAEKTGITPFFTDGTVAFNEASLVFVCRKLYAGDFDLDKLNDDEKNKWYGTDPVHKQYIGEIIKVYSK